MSTRDCAHTSLQRPAPCTLAISGFLRSKSRNIDLRERMGVSPLYSGRTGTVKEKKSSDTVPPLSEPFQLRSLFDALTNRKTVRLPPRLDGSKTTSTRLLATASPHVGGLQLCTQFSLNVCCVLTHNQNDGNGKKFQQTWLSHFFSEGGLGEKRPGSGRTTQISHNAHKNKKLCNTKKRKKGREV